MGSGEDRRWVFTNEIPHQTAVKTEQLRNQANRVSRVDSTSLALRGLPWGTEWYTHWVCYPVCQRPIPETHTRHHANHANRACTKQDTRSTIIPCIKQCGVCLRWRLLVLHEVSFSGGNPLLAWSHHLHCMMDRVYCMIKLKCSHHTMNVTPHNKIPLHIVLHFLIKASHFAITTTSSDDVTSQICCGM